MDNRLFCLLLFPRSSCKLHPFRMRVCFQSRSKQRRHKLCMRTSLYNVLPLASYTLLRSHIRLAQFARKQNNARGRQPVSQPAAMGAAHATTQCAPAAVTLAFLLISAVFVPTAAATVAGEPDP